MTHADALNQHNRETFTTPFPKASSRWLSHEELTKHGKTYEFHRYDNTGHAFFSVDSPRYRVEAANDGWQRIFDFYGKYLR